MKIVIWHNLNNDTYYHKLVSGNYTDYKIGYKNQYNHEVIDIIEQVYRSKYHVSLKRRLIRRLIRFLEKIK